MTHTDSLVTLQVPQKYCLNLPLRYDVDPSVGKAKFDKASGKLEISLRVLRIPSRPSSATPSRPQSATSVPQSIQKRASTDPLAPAFCESTSSTTAAVSATHHSAPNELVGQTQEGPPHQRSDAVDKTVPQAPSWGQDRAANTHTPPAAAAPTAAREAFGAAASSSAAVTSSQAALQHATGLLETPPTHTHDPAAHGITEILQAPGRGPSSHHIHPVSDASSSDRTGGHSQSLPDMQQAPQRNLASNLPRDSRQGPQICDSSAQGGPAKQPLSENERRWAELHATLDAQHNGMRPL